MSLHHAAVPRHFPRRKAVAAVRAMNPADQLWAWRGAFLLGAAAWFGLACLIKVIV